jgi:DNA-binding response OmpR family regulator
MLAINGACASEEEHRADRSGQRLPVVVFVGTLAEAACQIDASSVSGAVIMIVQPVGAGSALAEGSSQGSSNGLARTTVDVEDLHIDLLAHRVHCRGEPMSLTEQDFQLLSVLGKAPGRAWSFRELSSKVWMTDYYSSSAPVRCAVQRLRKKLLAAGSSARIESVRSVGFRLVAPR